MLNQQFEWLHKGFFQLSERATQLVAYECVQYNVYNLENRNVLIENMYSAQLQLISGTHTFGKGKNIDL